MNDNSLLNTIELISAGAGTGKTYRLTERIVEEVTSGVEPDRIMATTFTVKAAAELRERVRESLARQGRADLGIRIDDAYVGTVHSLCFRLLKEYAIDAGISPDIEVLPEGDADRIFNIAVETAVESVADKLEPIAYRMSRTGAGSGNAREGDWRDDVRAIVGSARANGIAPAELRGHAAETIALWETVVSTEGPPPTVQALIEAATGAVEQLDAIEKPFKGTQEVTDSLRQFLAESSRETSVPWKWWLGLAGTTPKRDAEGILDHVHAIARRVCETPQFLEDFQTLVEGVYACAAEALDLFSEYKRARGLTDFDDLETSLLSLLTDSTDVQQGIRERIDVVMVDEFQDTSPMQLALFLELHRITGRSVWVGDPKQAIYAFRGTDPALMTQVADLIDSRETLSRSWRSRQAILDATNAIFTQALYDTPREKVELTLPDQRSEAGQGGRVSAWYLDSGNKSDDAGAIAAGVRSLLDTQPERLPGEVAVLCRSNSHCSAVADALNTQGIRASLSAGLLTETREIQIILAGLRYLAENEDTLALTELIVLISPQEGCLSALITAPDETLTAWKHEQIPAELSRIGERADQLSVMEAVDAVIAVTDIPRIVSAWSRPDVRRGNIETLRGLAREYEEVQHAAGTPASVHGFTDYVGGNETRQAQGSGSDSCVVTTYHGAKGLEWPVVILAELDKTFEGTPFGVHIIPAERFDPTTPLAGRRIHYWPWPFGLKKKFPHLERQLAETLLQKQIRTAQHDESIRLLYVGATRPKDHLIMTVRNRTDQGLEKPNDSWLRRLTDRDGHPLIQWPAARGDTQLPVGTVSVSVDISVHAPESGTDDRSNPEQQRGGADPKWPVRDVMEPVERVPRMIVPSQIGDDTPVHAAVQLSETGPTVHVTSQPTGSDPDSTDLGNGVHAVFACAPLHRIPGKASDILRRWGVEEEIADAVTAAVDALDAYLYQRYSVTGLYREWPVFLRLETGEEMQGWIDLLVETPEGWVIVDHKTYHGKDPATEAARYGLQLSRYRHAVESATGKPVTDTLINFPLLGVVYRIEI